MYIKISEDFSDTPGARYYEDGEFSGQEFFETVLLKSFKEATSKDEKLTVDFDDCYGFASSFLSESFGRLGQECGSQKVRETLILVSNQDPFLPKQVLAIIENPVKGDK